MKKTLFVILALGIALPVMGAGAQQVGPSSGQTVQDVAKQQAPLLQGFGAGNSEDDDDDEATSTQNLIQARTQERFEVLSQYREEFQEDREAYLEAVRERREEMVQQAQQNREEIRNDVEQMRNEYREQVQERRQELLQQLAQFRNEEKAQIIATVDEQLRALNERLLDHFADLLEQLELVLANIQSRIDKVAALGTDVTSINTLVDTAQTKIADARKAITDQADNVYTIVIENEEDARADVGVVRQQLQDDLSVVRTAVIAARSAVHDIAVALAQLPRVDEEPEDVDENATSTD